MADLGEEAFSSQMKVVATFLRLLEELMRNKQQDLRYGTKTQGASLKSLKPLQ